MQILPHDIFRFPDLEGKTLVITGVTRGIGRAFLPYLLDQGLSLIAVSKGREELTALEKALRPGEGRFRGFDCDLADPLAVRETGQAIVSLGVPVDAVLHNAAIDPRHEFENGDENIWTEVLQVNLLAAVTLTRCLLPILRRSRSGRILFTGSVLAGLGGARLSAYSASKGAVESLTRSLAHELSGSGITVNCVVPGAIRVEKEAPGSDERLLSWQSTPWRLEPSHLIGLVCLLLSRWSDGINGETISVDGGILHPLAAADMQERVVDPPPV